MVTIEDLSMQRYHSVQGSGQGLDYRITQEEVGKFAMHKAVLGNGFWVLYDDAKKEIGAALAQGRAEGQTKLDAYMDLDKQEITQADLDTAYQNGLNNASEFSRIQGVVSDQADRIAARDKRTEQLLNELYHDRARLEKVVAEAASLVDLGHNLLLARQQGKDPSIVGDEDYILGHMAEFVDTHGDEA
jgi:hypothetical protein